MAAMDHHQMRGCAAALRREVEQRTSGTWKSPSPPRRARSSPPPYGDPEGPARGPRVRVTCATEGLRNEVPKGPFSARCLGKVQDWNAEEAVLEVQAMAIFR